MFVNKYKIIKPIGDGSSVNINLPTSQLPGLAGQTEIIENEFVDIEVKKSINEIIDYEKAKFLPIYIDNNDNNILVDDVTYIVNLYDSNQDYYSTTKWANAGFELEDIQNLKNSFTKTFLRLDFYDSDSNTKQNLLFFITLFPKVLIGGINLQNLYKLINYDFDCVAISQALFQSANLKHDIDRFFLLLNFM